MWESYLGSTDYSGKKQVSRREWRPVWTNEKKGNGGIARATYHIEPVAIGLGEADGMRQRMGPADL